MAIILKANGDVNNVSPKNGTDFELKELQEIVGGRIEIAYLQGGEIMVLNEEGKLIGLDVNERATRRYRIDINERDYVVGDVLICNQEEVK